MKAILCAIIIVFIGWVALNFANSEKLSSAVAVMKSDAENSVVDFAGKSKVAEQMAVKRLEDLRMKLVKIKANKRRVERLIADEKTSEDSKARYKVLLEKLSSAETLSTNAYKNANANLEALRVKLNILETEISVARSSSDALSFSKSKNLAIQNELDKLVESIEQDLDKANASLDVDFLEAEM